MSKELNVWWDQRQAGILHQTRGGALKFTYSQDWVRDPEAPPLSISLSKREEPFDERECRPFFAGLLPEEAQRRQAAAVVGVSDSNDFALLDALGEDVAGAIVFLPREQMPPAEAYRPQAHALSDNELVAVLDKLPRRPFLADEDGLRLSLAGAQSKLPVVMVDGRVALPARGQPTTHILKPPIPEHPGTTENEALVMRLARAVGLNVAEVEPRIVGERTFLLITRYDRVSGPDGRTVRLHQEDFCQALGVLPHRKYAKEGGPGFKDCFALLRRASSRPAKDVLALLDAALFNSIVGNADAHGKNFSILHARDGTQMAPLYDLLSTLYYPALSPNLAMKIGRASRIEELDDENWSRFSMDIGVLPAAIRRRAETLRGKMANSLDEVRKTLHETGLSAQSFDDVAKAISDRIELTAARMPKRVRTTEAKKPEVSLTLDMSAFGSNMVGLRIANRTAVLLTGCRLTARIMNEEGPPYRIVENVVCPPGLDKAFPLIAFGGADRRDSALLQFQRTPGFFQSASLGRLQSGNELDVRLSTDQGIHAVLRCRLVTDDDGHVEVKTA